MSLDRRSLLQLGSSPALAASSPGRGWAQDAAAPAVKADHTIRNDTGPPEALHWEGQRLAPNVDRAEEEGTRVQEAEVGFVTDNPGLMLFHCHQQLHMDYGFMALFDCAASA